MSDSKYTTKDATNILQPTIGTHWILYMTRILCFESYGCPPRKIIDQSYFYKNGKAVFSVRIIQEKDR